MSPAAAPLKGTPFFSLQRELGAKRVDFGGCEVPVQYEGIPGTELEVDIRGRKARARIVETPFSKRKREAPA